MRTSARWIPTGVVVLLATTAGLGDVALGETIHVKIQGLSFSPASISVHAGDTVEWVNEDFVTHSATARDGSWDVQLPAHSTGRTAIKGSDTIEYYCRYHPNMKGQITITSDKTGG